MKHLLKIFSIITIITALSLTNFANAETLEDLAKELGDIKKAAKNFKIAYITAYKWYKRELKDPLYFTKKAEIEFLKFFE